MTRRFRAPEIPLGHGRALILHPRFKPPYLFKRTFIARAHARSRNWRNSCNRDPSRRTLRETRVRGDPFKV